MSTSTSLAPAIKFYNTLEDMIYDADIAYDEAYMASLPPAPVKIEKINGTQDLLNFIGYVKEHSLYKQNMVYKYLVKAEEPIKELNNMIGMNKIKASIATQIIYYAKKLARGAGKLDQNTVVYLNTAIYGSPGSGKTTIARIIGQLYHKLGVAQTDKFIVGRRDTMIGKYLGQTAPATRKVIESAEGGTLFLDEVYQFGSSADGNRDSYAKEVVDTINQYITDNPGKVIFIVAGYRDQVKSCFFAQNEGLERRFRWSYTIEGYSPHDLLQIFYKQAKESGYQIIANQMALPAVQVQVPVSDTTIVKKKRQLEPVVKLKVLDSPGIKFFTSYKAHFKYGGGDTETFLDKCKMINEKRTIADPHDEGKINDEDIDCGLEEYLEYVRDRTIVEHKPPEGMYT